MLSRTSWSVVFTTWAILGALLSRLRMPTIRKSSRWVRSDCDSAAKPVSTMAIANDNGLPVERAPTNPSAVSFTGFNYAAAVGSS